MQSSKVGESGISIKIGTTTDLTKQLAYAGKGIVKGIEVYFNKINRDGGIDGRSLEYIVLDDQNDLQKSVANIHQLIEQENVIALIGNGGGQKVALAVPLVNQSKTLLFAPFATNAVLYQNPPHRYVINFMASPGKIAQEVISGLISQDIHPEEIAFFTENSAVGDFIYAESCEALINLGYLTTEKLLHGRFALLAPDVEEGLSTLVSGTKKNGKDLKAIIIGANAPVAQAFIKKAKKLFTNAIYVSINGFFCSDPEDAVIIGNLYVPPPFKPTGFAAINEFYEAIQTFETQENNPYYLFYGYLSAKLLVEGLKQAAQNKALTKEGLVEAFESMREVDIGIDCTITIDKSNHGALHKGWLIYLKKNEEYETFDWNKLSVLSRKRFYIS